MDNVPAEFSILILVAGESQNECGKRFTTEAQRHGEKSLEIASEAAIDFIRLLRRD
jgi:hypothetical protein